MKKVEVKKKVVVGFKYVLKAFDDVRMTGEKTFDNEPTEEEIAQFCEDTRCIFCTMEKRYCTSDGSEFDEEDEDEDEDWDEDDWDV